MEESQIFHLEGDYKLVTGFYNEKFKSVFKLTSRIKLTCVSACTHHVAMGTNGGSVYILTRHNMKYFTHFVANADYSLLAVKFSPNGKFLATILQDGSVLIYGMPTDSGLKMECLRKCLHHRKSEVTAQVWDSQSSVLYTGDKNGVVAATHCPVFGARDFFTTTNEPILKLDCEVVQLDSFDQYVLVSTFEKCLLCNNASRQFITIGTKPRKGLYGACFWLQEGGDYSSVKIVCARPGLRFWIASLRGVVEQTQQYKDLSSVVITKTWNQDQIESPTQMEESSGELFSYLSPIKYGLLCAVTPKQRLFLIDPLKMHLIAHIEMLPKKHFNFQFDLYEDSLFVLDSERSFYSINFTTKWITIDLLMKENQFSLAYDLVLDWKSQITDKRDCDFDILSEAYRVLTPDQIDSLINHALSAQPRKSHEELIYLKEDLFKEPEYQQCHLPYFSQYSDEPDSPVSPEDIVADNLSQDEEMAALKGNSPPPPVIQIHNHSPTASLDNDDAISLNSNDSDASWFKEVMDNTRSSTSLGFKNISSKFDKLKKQLKIPQKNRDIIKRLREKTSSVLSLENVEHLLTMVDTRDYEESVPARKFSDNYLNQVFDNDHSYPKLINFVELEADVYITWEKLKDHVSTCLTPDNKSVLTNFITIFNKLTMLNWKNRFDFELHKAQLSVSVMLEDLPSLSHDRYSPIILSGGTESRSDTTELPSADSEAAIVDQSFFDVSISNETEQCSASPKQEHVSYSVSRNQTLSTSLWARPLNIPLKIHGLTGFLLTLAFENYVYGENFREIDRFFNETVHVTSSQPHPGEEEEITNETYRSIAIQVHIDVDDRYGYINKTNQFDASRSEFVHRLVHELVDLQMWQDPGCHFYQNMPHFVTYYGSFLDKVHIRHWLKTCSIHPDLWRLILESLSNYLSNGRTMSCIKESFNPIQLIQLLHDSILEESLESLIVLNHYLTMIGTDPQLTDFLVQHSQYLSFRDIVYLCLCHDKVSLMADYFNALRNHQNKQIRVSLCDRICSNQDIFLCVVVGLLCSRQETQSATNRQNHCECGYFQSEEESQFIHKDLLRDVISTFCSRHKSASSLPYILDRLASMFMEFGFAYGYLEILTMQKRTDDIIKMGIQLANEQILNRIKDYTSIDEPIIESCIKYKLQQDTGLCLECAAHLSPSSPGASSPITWEQMAFFMLRHVSLQETILLLLELEDEKMNDIGPFLNSIFADSLASLTNRKSFSSDQLAPNINDNAVINFIRREIQLSTQLEPGTVLYKEEHQSLTEDLLNYFVSDRTRLISSTNWGFLFKKDIECSICGIELQNSATCSLNMVAFCCGHIYHQDCIDGESKCIICLFC